MWNQRPCFRFEIDNFSEKEAEIASQIFVSGGCEWYLYVYPKGDSLAEDHVSLFLYVANPKSLRTGWQRSANYYFVALNQPDKELYRSAIGEPYVFCAETPGWGFSDTLPLSKFQEKRFLEKDRLIIEVYISILDVLDGEGKNVSEKKEIVDINSFSVFASQATSLQKIFVEHPDIAEGLKPKIQSVKTAYINVLLNLIETLHKPSKSLSEAQLKNAQIELNELMEVGFKLEWLMIKLEKVSLDKKIANTDGLRIQQLEERLKDLELTVSDYKVELDKEKAIYTTTTAQVLCLEQNFSYLKVEMEKERANSAISTAQVLCLEQTLSDLKVEMEREKEKEKERARSVTSTDAVLPSEEDDLLLHSKYKGIQHRRYGYKRIN